MQLKIRIFWQVFGEVLSNMLYERRFGPFFVNPVRNLR